MTPAPGPKTELVRDLWAEWTTMVEAVARRTQVDWSEDEYTQVHETLLAVLRKVSAGPSDPCAALYARLETCAEPWVTARSQWWTSTRYGSTLLVITTIGRAACARSMRRSARSGK